MAKLGPSEIFNCTEAYCFEGTVYPRKIHSPTKIDLGVSLSRIWLIRSGFVLEDTTEQEIIDHLADNGIAAEWVDSESDAHAMREEETA